MECEGLTLGQPVRFPKELDVSAYCTEEIKAGMDAERKARREWEDRRREVRWCAGGGGVTGDSMC